MRGGHVPLNRTAPADRDPRKNEACKGWCVWENSTEVASGRVAQEASQWQGGRIIQADMIEERNEDIICL